MFSIHDHTQIPTTPLIWQILKFANLSNLPLHDTYVHVSINNVMYHQYYSNVAWHVALTSIILSRIETSRENCTQVLSCTFS